MSASDLPALTICAKPPPSNGPTAALRLAAATSSGVAGVTWSANIHDSYPSNPRKLYGRYDVSASITSAIAPYAKACPSAVEMTFAKSPIFKRAGSAGFFCRLNSASVAGSTSHFPSQFPRSPSAFSAIYGAYVPSSLTICTTLPST
ncbi:hypothetical protein D3C81_1446710 [compost metagenome]